MRFPANVAIALLVAFLGGSVVMTQIADPFRLSRDHPAIQYSTRPSHDAIVALNEQIAKGATQLTSEGSPRGYLAAVLKALNISPASQVLVFSENSLQRAHISKATPRAIYFNDTVAVSWSNGAETIEATALDATQGVHFYSIAQEQGEPRQFARRTDCLECHLMPQTLGIPGLFVMSQLPLSDNQSEYAQGWAVDDRTPIEDRWGGWYVTGTQVPSKHLGNVAVSHVPRSYVRADAAPKLASGKDAFDTSAYLTPYSDIVALMVLNHQMYMTNLLIRLGWEVRIEGSDPLETARDVADYMLFVDEASLPSPVKGSSGFAEEFSARGPRDSKGRSLRDLDLGQRLFRYRCSYMIYSEAFDALPPAAKGYVYDRMWEVLATASTPEKRATIEILNDTKPDWASRFGSRR